MPNRQEGMNIMKRLVVLRIALVAFIGIGLAHGISKNYSPVGNAVHYEAGVTDPGMPDVQIV